VGYESLSSHVGLAIQGTSICLNSYFLKLYSLDITPHNTLGSSITNSTMGVLEYSIFIAHTSLVYIWAATPIRQRPLFQYSLVLAIQPGVE